MTVRDRTQEFLSLLTAFENYRHSSTSSTNLSNRSSNNSNNSKETHNISNELISKSLQIHNLSKNLIDRILETSDKIEQLTSLAKITSNFRDERPKMQTLTFDIKKDIETLNIDIKALDINICINTG